MRLVFVFPFLLLVNSLAAQESHGHQGVLTPYAGEPPEIILTGDEQNTLKKGKPIFKKIDVEKAKRGIAIFRVNADQDTVWSVIKDFSSYPKWIEDIDETEIYSQRNNLFHVKFSTSGWLVGTTSWYAVHDYPNDNDSERNWGTWTLDYNYRSDIDDSVGFWRVLPVSGQTNQSDVIYSADLRLKGLFVSLFESSLIDSSLKDATQWVKIQAEKRSTSQ
ncbi:MAG: SRPBCC family protein [Thiotrichales bacterium]|nr:SRPBCC family protein [Thiotrichales bacterium]